MGFFRRFSMFLLGRGGLQGWWEKSDFLMGTCLSWAFMIIVGEGKCKFEKIGFLNRGGYVDTTTFLEYMCCLQESV